MTFGRTKFEHLIEQQRKGAKMRKPEQDKRNQQYCSKCGRIVGCDHHGRLRKCECKDQPHLTYTPTYQ